MQRWTVDAQCRECRKAVTSRTTPNGEWVLHADTLPRVLTEADEEPAVGSVVLDEDSVPWWRGALAWRWLGNEHSWSSLVATYGPVRLIWDGASE